MFAEVSNCLSVGYTRHPEHTLDMDMALDSVVPESLNWRHTDEGPE
jgi:hypothetical protein